jgi:exonuclease III
MIDTSDLEIDEVIAENKEGRVAMAEYEDFIYVTVYTPNSK